MRRSVLAPVLGAALALVMGAAAWAQQDDDGWDLSRDSARGLAIASVGYEDGPVLAVRCMGGVFDVILTGMPPFRESRRILEVAFGGDEPQEQYWTQTAVEGVVASNFPATFARRLREARTLTVIASGEDGASRVRRVLPLPASSVGLDAVMSACGKPVVDPRQPTDFVEIGAGSRRTWARPPSPSYPDLALSREANTGHVGVSCVAEANGRLRDCQVESEIPGGVGFGARALSAAREGRVTPLETTSNAAHQTQLVTFMVLFRAGY